MSRNGGTVTSSERIANSSSQGTTPQQLVVLLEIRLARNRHPAYGPSIAELATACCVNVNDIYQKLVRLRRDGLVTWDEGVARSIRLVDEEYQCHE